MLYRATSEMEKHQTVHAAAVGIIYPPLVRRNTMFLMRCVISCCNPPEANPPVR